MQLIKSFPAINKQDNYQGNTALHYAAQRNYYDCAAELIAMGADESVNYLGQTAIYLADVNLADKNGWTPIFPAVFKSNLPMIELLVSLGADVDHTDSKGWTPLFYAIQKGDDQAVQLLLMHCRNIGYECVVKYSAIGLTKQIRDQRVRELISGRVEIGFWLKEFV